MQDELVQQPKPCKDLVRGDEFETYCGDKWRRARVLAVRRSGDRVIVTIAPAGSRRPEAAVQAQFWADALVQVWGAPSATPSPPDALLVRAIMRVMKPGVPLRSIQQIADAIALNEGVRPARHSVAIACNYCAKKGYLLKRTIGKNMNHYRAPIAPSNALVGAVVVESPGLRSERLGWIVKFDKLQTTGRMHPVCRWLDGALSFSSDDLLEIVHDLDVIDRVVVARHLAAGRIPPGWRSIPSEVMAEVLKLARTTPKGRRYDPEVIYQVAQAIGVLGADEKPQWSHWNAAVSYLDKYCPGWRKGRLAFPLEEHGVSGGSIQKARH